MQPVIYKKSTGTRRVNVHRAPRTPLLMYLKPPTDQIPLEEFENAALDRLSLLKEIDNTRVRDGGTPLFRKKVLELSKKYMPIDHVAVGGSEKAEAIATQLEQMKRDHISHFILRLAMCDNDESRRWLAAQELSLFRVRFENATDEDRKNFLSYVERYTSNKYEPIPKDEYERLKDSLQKAAGTKATEFYRVPFEEVTNLVKKRRVFLRAGQAYVPRDALIEILSGLFRSRLYSGLNDLRRILPAVKGDERVAPLLKHIQASYDTSSGGGAYGQIPKGAVKPEQLDFLAENMFPLCMRNCHRTLRRDHHLRHSARMQYGLFLKGIGMSLEDSLRFWKSEFTKSVGADKFDRNYAYNIRHNYGQEGKRVDYTPYSCMHIVKMAAVANEAHGCPYRHWPVERIESEVMNQLTALKKERDRPVREIAHQIAERAHDHCMVVCQYHFEALHPGSDAAMLGIGNHPNTFFSEGLKVEGNDPDAKYETPITEQVNQQKKEEEVGPELAPETTK